MTHITIAMPNIDQIQATGLTNVMSDLLVSNNLSVDLSDASRATLNLASQNLSVKTQDAASITLTGTTTSATFATQDVSQVKGQKFIVGQATIKAQDFSHDTLTVSNVLNAEAHDFSKIIYYSNPAITKQVYDMATVSSEQSIGTTTEESSE